ncbi:hypothetical protein LGT39_03115 [Demequina sp. TTPB684]|uniref:hypothetical protein n=1 Tax=unclassified Demequina TaxID=2620311 RepID=UPI001CF1AE5A|nr:MULTISPECIES: hypothetical protein [unclassified Demequina]MCB2411840.1 hypothetical protein [Demequina sp. TTPB684]UPU87261.1 hypothetical protein LGT36_008225 [Demequina sp. TMPB413]
MTATDVMETVQARLKSTRGWLAASVVLTGAIAWLAVAWASNRSLEHSGHLGVVGVSLALGCGEVAYLAWHNWTHRERGIAVGVAVAASVGSLLILGAAYGGVTAQDFFACAAGVGVLGMSTAVGLFGMYRSTGKSSPATLAGMFIVMGLAYFASILWGAVPQ